MYNGILGTTTPPAIVLTDEEQQSLEVELLGDPDDDNKMKQGLDFDPHPELTAAMRQGPPPPQPVHQDGTNTNHQQHTPSCARPAGRQ